MEKFRTPLAHRRAFLGAVLALGAPGLVHAAQRHKAPPSPPLVTVLGDSITAGLGLTQDRALPAWLQRTLDGMKIQARVFGFGAIGDTTKAGLSRVERIPPETAVCVVALGGNDLLQGADPAWTRENLRAIVTRLKARGVRVVLAGMRAPGLLGIDYARRFTEIYPALAREEGVFYAPDFFTGVIGVSRYMQSDGIHPNAEGARIIAERLAPVVAKALRG